MVLLDDVVEVFDLTSLNTRLMVRVVAFDRRRVRSAFVDCDLLRCTMLIGEANSGTFFADMEARISSMASALTRVDPGLLI
jgi:hypothetical protein